MKLDLTDVLVRTGVARSGMTVGEVFEECAACGVPGLPYCDKRDRIVGRVSIRHTLKQTCIPDFLVHGAHLLGDVIEAVKIPDRLARDVLAMPVDEFVLTDPLVITPAAPIVKVLAIMERSNTAYLFVAHDGKYLGMITRMGIARLMLKTRKP